MKNFPRILTHGSGVDMTLDLTRLLLVFKAKPKPSDLATALKRLELVLEDADQSERKSATLADTVNHTATRFWVRTADDQPITDENFSDLEKGLGASFDFASAVYRLPGAYSRGRMISPLANVLLVGGSKHDPELAKMIEQAGMKEVTEKSKFLGEYRYFTIAKPAARNAYQLREMLGAQMKRGVDIRLENMPMVVPTTAMPNDTLFPQQWDMTRINGPAAWDISIGGGVVVSVMDRGCDLTHPDLSFSGQGLNLGSMVAPGSPVGLPAGIGHGTACAGIVAANFNNSAGTAGVAGGAQILPVAFQNWTDAECASGINWSAANGARVISMSFGVYAPGDGFGPTGWDFTIIDPAISNAVNVANVVLVAATGNENTSAINRYPARNPLVIACGGSDVSDNRKNPASPDGECWGANFGPGTSVVAPAVLCPTTDIQGAGGYNNNGGSGVAPCVTYPSAGDAAGNYFLQFNGTSAATPHTAGFAALLASAYPSLNNTQIRSIIERTAAKVGGTYADASGFPNGTRTAAMGYGRIDLFRGLDLADVMIRDWSGDNGVEPSSPPGGDFWDFSDLVVRPTDDNIFTPSDVSLSNQVTRGQTNYIYVRVVNQGPREARNVTVNTRITPWVGTQFVYPGDWTTVDANHVQPAAVLNTFATIPSGGSVIAKFTVSSADVDALWGWVNSMSWHPCMLAAVTADNDYAFASAAGGSGLQVFRNNLAQRNLTVVPVLADATVSFPFIAAHRLNLDREMQLTIDRSRLPKGAQVFLSLADASAAFPQFRRPEPLPGPAAADCMEEIVFLDRTRIEKRSGCCQGVLVLEKGSSFRCLQPRTAGNVKVNGGRVVLEGSERLIEVLDEKAVVTIQKEPGQMYPLSLRIRIPSTVRRGDQMMVRVSQQSPAGLTLGGATAVYVTE